MAARICWEDLTAGSVHELGTTEPISAEEIKEFAGRFDPQPFHLDEEAGRQSLFGGLCASGWHTCSLAMRLMVDNLLKDSSSLGSPGMETCAGCNRSTPATGCPCGRPSWRRAACARGRTPAWSVHAGRCSTRTAPR
jgi:hypothetical protein